MIRVSKLLPLLVVYMLACGGTTVKHKPEPTVQLEPECQALPGTTCFKYNEAPGRQASEPIIPTSLQTKNRNPIRHEKIR